MDSGRRTIPRVDYSVQYIYRLPHHISDRLPPMKYLGKANKNCYQHVSSYCRTIDLLIKVQMVDH